VIRLRGLLAAALLTAAAACAPKHAPAPKPLGIVAVPAAHAPRWSPADLRALQRALHGVFAETSLAMSGVAIVDADARPLYGVHERAPFTPASTFKLLAGIAALETLGPQFRFPTELRALDAPQRRSNADER